MHKVHIEHLHFGELHEHAIGKEHILHEDVKVETGSRLRGCITNLSDPKGPSIESTVEIEVKHNNIKGALRELNKYLTNIMRIDNIKCGIDPIIVYKYSGTTM